MSTMNSYRGKKTVLMFPRLGHGHISPFLELAKKLSNTNLFNIYLCSTPANLDSVKKNLKNDVDSPSITLVELHLSTLPELPPHLHTTNGLPLHLMPLLKEAFDKSSPQFSRILNTLKPHLLIYDMIQSWAPVSAADRGIPSVMFIATSATMAATMFHLYYFSEPRKGTPFPFPKFFFRTYEQNHMTEILESSANNVKDKNRVMGCVGKSSRIVLVKSFKEIEGDHADYLSRLTGKKVVSVGPLVANPPCHAEIVLTAFGSDKDCNITCVVLDGF
ncbi:hypothetical protein L1987_47721 [Smallanthus sonchifolius]|uniref:Uncharacterized protein n=1 Tax=Smallanthus sonchifolius TaxID=185202 RepID=A0ACB9G4D3_9ASTR|nr:hypothetical protein L1987_47721 [Smallanthus sonchifolius]